MAKKKKTTPDSRQAARDTAIASGEKVKKMPSERHRKIIAECQTLLLDTAPSMEAAESDLLQMMQVIGLLFVKRYYGTATDASFHVSRYPKEAGRPEFHVMLPIPVPG